MRPASVGATLKARPARRERARAPPARARACRFDNSFQSRRCNVGCKISGHTRLWGVRTMVASARRLRDESGPRQGAKRSGPPRGSASLQPRSVLGVVPWWSLGLHRNGASQRLLLHLPATGAGLGGSINPIVYSLAQASAVTVSIPADPLSSIPVGPRRQRARGRPRVFLGGPPAPRTPIGPLGAAGRAVRMRGDCVDGQFPARGLPHQN